MSAAFDFQPLTAPQMLDLRRLYIRDEAILASGSTPASYLSRFNMGHKINYWTDEDLQALDDRVVAAYRDNLNELRLTSYANHLANFAPANQAQADADAEMMDARFRLIRSEAWALMMADPAFRASLMVGDNPGSMNALLEAWAAIIKQDQLIGAGEGAGGVISIPMARR